MDFGLGYLWVGDGGCLWILAWVICGSAAEVWVLVWIGCGSVMEVCDFSLGRRLKCGFWFGSVVGRRWRFLILVWIGGGSAAEVCVFWFGSARWVCFGLSKGFVGLLWFEQRFSLC